MEQPVDDAWWQLHLRSARGETLTPDEAKAYEQGLSILDEHEVVSGVDALLRTRAAIKDAEARQATLRGRQASLARQITALERALNEETRRALGIVD